MLFDFKKFIKEGPKKAKNQNIIKRYTKYFGSLKNMDLYDTVFYKKYLSKFKIPFVLSCPKDLEDKFDWDLLIRLIAGSQASEYEMLLDDRWLENPVGKPVVHLYITAKFRDQKHTEDVCKLSDTHILQIYEIYILEQMELYTIEAKDAEENEDETNGERESDMFIEEQDKRLRRFENITKNIMETADSQKDLHAMI